MDEKKLKALAAELAKGLKTEADLKMLTKLTVETALNAGLTDRLG
ncbi:TPA_asm: IS256 family transposase, partial [Salmonella enterica subsp. houtenae serovar 45:g,z51:-]|nr:IS256 family transposase [Salmonella enterica subsp. houtenae str. CFSAN000557]HAE7766013.1 IS256 family transposase [Salmonella enterica subsp. houtenae serovar 45:g,z51:-]